MAKKRRHPWKVIIFAALAVILVGLAGWAVWQRHIDKDAITATITATPESGGRLGAGYSLGGGGQSYQIYAMYGGPAGYDGKLDCVKLPENLAVGDKVKFHLPANPSLTTGKIKGYAICYPAGQNQDYYLREL